jgi:hypothetical protein
VENQNEGIPAKSRKLFRSEKVPDKGKKDEKVPLNRE